LAIGRRVILSNLVPEVPARAEFDPDLVYFKLKFDLERAVAPVNKRAIDLRLSIDPDLAFYLPNSSKFRRADIKAEATPVDAKFLQLLVAEALKPSVEGFGLRDKLLDEIRMGDADLGAIQLQSSAEKPLPSTMEASRRCMRNSGLPSAPTPTA